MFVTCVTTFLLRVLHLHLDPEGHKIEWKYFANSHGKCVVGEIGGSAKSLVRKKVMTRGNNFIVTCVTSLPGSGSIFLLLIAKVWWMG